MNIEQNQESEKILRFKNKAKYRLLKNKLITILILNFIPFFSILFSLVYYKWFYMNFTKNKIWIGLFYTHDMETEKVYSMNFFKNEICQKMGDDAKEKNENINFNEVIENDNNNTKKRLKLSEIKKLTFEAKIFPIDGNYKKNEKNASAINFELQKKIISKFNSRQIMTKPVINDFLLNGFFDLYAKNSNNSQYESEFLDESIYNYENYYNTSDCYLLNYFEAFGLITGIISFLGLVGQLIIIVQLNFLIFDSDGILTQRICSLIKTKTLKITVFIIHFISISLWFLFLEGLQIQNGQYGLCFYLFLGSTGFILLLYFWFRSIKKKLKDRKMISHLLGL